MLIKSLSSFLATSILVAGLAGMAAAEPVTLRVVVKDVSTSNPEDVAHIARIEQAMAAQGNDIKIELVDLPGAGYADKLALMLLSGDIPDLIYFQGGDITFANQGILEDWRPWIEKAPNLKAALWPHNIERLDNYPYLLYPFPARTKSPVIRTDFLEALGIDPPQTLDDWVDMLRRIANADLDGDGIKDTFGINVPGSTFELDAIFNMAFGVTSTWLKNDDGAWINAHVSDQERDKITFYRSLFAEGLLDPEFLTNNFEAKEDKFYTGRTGVILGTAGPVVNIYRTKLRRVNPGAELTLLSPPKGIVQGLAATDVSKESRGFAMSTLSKHKAEVLAFMDFLASPEGQFFEQLGFEGVHYTRDGDKITLTEKIGTWYPRFFIDNPAAYTPPVSVLSPVAEASLEQGKEFFKPDNAFVFPAEFATDVDATNNLYRTAAARFITGQVSLDDWDAYVADWNRAGGARITEFANTVLNETK